MTIENSRGFIRFPPPLFRGGGDDAMMELQKNIMEGDFTTILLIDL